MAAGERGSSNRRCRLFRVVGGARRKCTTSRPSNIPDSNVRIKVRFHAIYEREELQIVRLINQWKTQENVYTLGLDNLTRVSRNLQRDDGKGNKRRLAV